MLVGSDRLLLCLTGNDSCFCLTHSALLISIALLSITLLYWLLVAINIGPLSALSTLCPRSALLSPIVGSALVLTIDSLSSY